MRFETIFRRWSRPASDVLLVDSERTSELSNRLTQHLPSVGVSAAVVQRVGRARSELVHYLDYRCFEATANASGRSPLVVNIDDETERDWSPYREVAQKRAVTLVAASQEVASSIGPQLPGVEVVVIPRGIAIKGWKPTRIDGRLAARNAWDVPPDAVCLGVFRELDEAELSELVVTLDHLRQSWGDVALLSVTPQVRNLASMRWQGTAIAVDLKTPSLLRQAYAALDVYLDVSRQGDERGVLQSWAAGIPVASLPNLTSSGLLQDGWTASIAAKSDGLSLAHAAHELLVHDDFRHSCCRQGVLEVQRYAWPQVLGCYQRLYEQYLVEKQQAA